MNIYEMKILNYKKAVTLVINITLDILLARGIKSPTIWLIGSNGNVSLGEPEN